MASKIKVDTIENVAGSGNVSLGSGHNLVVPGDLTVDTSSITGTTSRSFTEQRITSSTSGIGELRFADTTVNAGYIKYDHSGNNMILATNVTERLRIDSSGNVQVGSASSVTGGRYFDIYNTGSTATDFSILRFITQQVGSSSTVSGEIYKRKNGQFTITNGETNSAAFTSFQVGASERMRIDSSGNLLVGTTSYDGSHFNDGAGGGFAVTSAGKIDMKVDGTVANFNRTNSSDGDILYFAKQGSGVGSIFSNGGKLTINSLGSNLSYAVGGTVIMNNDTTQFYPQSDNAVSLGISSLRWRDLWLSGGIYLGGTAAVNKMDDYEEGTWTPIIHSAGGTPTTYSLGVNGNYGYYTKVGNIVTAHAHCVFQRGTATGAIDLGGLPFTSANVTTGYASTTTSYWNLATAIVKVEMHLNPNSTRGSNTTRIATGATASMNTTLQSGNLNTGSNTIVYSITYRSA